MSEKSVLVPQDKIEEQLRFISFLRQLFQKQEQETGRKKAAYTMTFGCQQNEADSQRIAGMLQEMGCEHAPDAEHADIIVINTCAVREHAENRVLGIVGAMAHLKKLNPDLLICMCGCMVQQESMTEKIRKSYPQVSLVFGTHALWRFPELLYRTVTGDKRIMDISGQDGIAEGLPVLRDGKTHAWLSIMYGCNNFCSYCIVPYVRGRERSRAPEVIEKELCQLVAEGYRDITLLGQNVNSYGKDLGGACDFSDLLRRLNEVPGDFLLRFMTSHPKDAGERLFDAMAECSKVAKQLHLPFQSGSDRILKQMNRGYTAQHYRNLVKMAREKMPSITLSSDIIVGFPGETEEDFCLTLDLVQDVEFDNLYTFLYSKRSGTPAAEMPDNSTKEEKQKRFERLLRLQDEISSHRQSAYQDKTVRVLLDGYTKSGKNEDFPYTARTEGGLLTLVRGEGLKPGMFAEVKIIKTSLRALFAEKCK